MPTPTPKLTVPTVHLNGTSRDALQQGYADAYAAMNDAIVVLAKTAPNARDYYVQPLGAFNAACDEHDARLAALAAVRDQMLALYDACS